MQIYVNSMLPDMNGSGRNRSEWLPEITEDLKNKYKVIDIDAMAEAKKIGNARVFNTIIVGIAAKHMDFDKDAWIKVIEKTVPAKTIDINKAAFEAGYNL